MRVAEHHTEQQLQDLARQQNDARLRVQLQAIVLARQKRAPDIAKALGHGRRTVQQWVHDYNAGGIDGLADRRGGNRLLREAHGMRSTIPPEHGRPFKDPNALPSDKYRRLMKHRFRDGSPASYRKRPQVETVFSMLKRNLGSALRAKTHQGRRRDLFLRVLTHNITLALRWVFYRALPTPLIR